MRWKAGEATPFDSLETNRILRHPNTKIVAMVRLRNTNVPSTAAIAGRRQANKDKTLNQLLPNPGGPRCIQFLDLLYRRRRIRFDKVIKQDLILIRADEANLDVEEWPKHSSPTLCRDRRSHKVVEEQRGTCYHY
jgi:hypothetical protein